MSVQLKKFILETEHTRCKVSFSKLAKEHCESVQKPPQLLCDFTATINWFFSALDSSFLDQDEQLSLCSILCGNDPKLYAERLLLFVNLLNKLGLEPVFLISCPPCEPNDVYITNYQSQSLHERSVVSSIHQVCDGIQSLTHAQWKLSEFAALHVESVLKRAGLKMVYLTEGLAHEVASYWEQHKEVCGVLTDDMSLFHSGLRGLKVFLPEKLKVTQVSGTKCESHLALDGEFATSSTLSLALKIRETQLAELVLLHDIAVMPDVHLCSLLKLSDSSVTTLAEWLREQQKPLSECGQLKEIVQSLENCTRDTYLGVYIRDSVRKGLMSPHLWSIANGCYWRPVISESLSIRSPCFVELTLHIRKVLYSLFEVWEYQEFGCSSTCSFTQESEMTESDLVGSNTPISLAQKSFGAKLVFLLHTMTGVCTPEDAENCDEQQNMAPNEQVALTAILVCSTLLFMSFSNDLHEPSPDLLFRELDAILVTCIVSLTQTPITLFSDCPTSRSVTVCSWFTHVLEHAYMVASLIGLSDLLPLPGDVFSPSIFLTFHKAALAPRKGKNGDDEQQGSNLKECEESKQEANDKSDLEQASHGKGPSTAEECHTDNGNESAANGPAVDQYQKLSWLEPVLQLSAEIINSCREAPTDITVFVQLFAGALDVVKSASTASSDSSTQESPSDGLGFLVNVDPQSHNLSSSSESGAYSQYNDLELSANQEHEALEEHMYFTLQDSNKETSPELDIEPAAECPSEDTGLQEPETQESLTQSSRAKKQKLKRMAKKQLPEAQLPIMEHREKILELVNSHTVVMIEGETGCGKSTKVPQFILDQCLQDSKPCKIIVTQPRRVAAMKLAERVAGERGEDMGSTVGFCIGGESQRTADTALTYCTVGYLLQVLLHNPDFIKGFTHVIIDEIHERCISTEFVLLVLRKLVLEFTGVKVILMSATLQGDVFVYYFEQVLEFTEISPSYFVGAKRFKVDNYFMDELEALVASRAVKEWHGKEQQASENLRTLASRMVNLSLKELRNAKPIVTELAMQVCTELVVSQGGRGEGILIFLPGIGEIMTYRDMLVEELQSRRISHNFSIFILHSQIPLEEQTDVFSDPPPNKIHVFLATNVAESSITLPNLKLVINFGIYRQLQYDRKRRLSCLRKCWCSRASCAQRSGRAGRVIDGVAVHLFTKRFYQCLMPEFTPPEMMNAPLAKLVLQAKAIASWLGMSSPSEVLMQAIEPPSLEQLETALKDLAELGAISSEPGKPLDENAQMTLLGEFSLSLPMDVDLSRLILYGLLFGASTEAIVIAAEMSLTNDVFCLPTKCIIAKEDDFIAAMTRSLDTRVRYDQGLFSDHIIVCRMFEEWIQCRVFASKKTSRYTLANRFCHNHAVSATRLLLLETTVAQISARLLSCIPSDSETYKNIKILSIVNRYLDNYSCELSKLKFCNNPMLVKSLITAAFSHQLILGLPEVSSHLPHDKVEAQRELEFMQNGGIDPMKCTVMRTVQQDSLKKLPLMIEKLLPGVQYDIRVDHKSVYIYFPTFEVCEQCLYDTVHMACQKCGVLESWQAYLHELSVFSLKVLRQVYLIWQFSERKNVWSIQDCEARFTRLEHPLSLSWTNMSSRKEMVGFCSYRNPSALVCDFSHHGLPHLGVASGFKGVEHSPFITAQKVTILPNIEKSPIALLLTLSFQSLYSNLSVQIDRQKKSVTGFRVNSHEILFGDFQILTSTDLIKINVLRQALSEVLTAANPSGTCMLSVKKITLISQLVKCMISDNFTHGGHCYSEASDLSWEPIYFDGQGGDSEFECNMSAAAAQELASFEFYPQLRCSLLNSVGIAEMVRVKKLMTELKFTKRALLPTPPSPGEAFKLSPLAQPFIPEHTSSSSGTPLPQPTSELNASASIDLTDDQPLTGLHASSSGGPSVPRQMSRPHTSRRHTAPRIPSSMLPGEFENLPNFANIVGSLIPCFWSPDMAALFYQRLLRQSMEVWENANKCFQSEMHWSPTSLHRLRPLAPHHQEPTSVASLSSHSSIQSHISSGSVQLQSSHNSLKSRSQESQPAQETISSLSQPPHATQHSPGEHGAHITRTSPSYILQSPPPGLFPLSHGPPLPMSTTQMQPRLPPAGVLMDTPPPPPPGFRKYHMTPPPPEFTKRHMSPRMFRRPMQMPLSMSASCVQSPPGLPPGFPRPPYSAPPSFPPHKRAVTPTKVRCVDPQHVHGCPASPQDNFRRSKLPAMTIAQQHAVRSAHSRLRLAPLRACSAYGEVQHSQRAHHSYKPEEVHTPCTMSEVLSHGLSLPPPQGVQSSQQSPEMQSSQDISQEPAEVQSPQEFLQPSRDPAKELPSPDVQPFLETEGEQSLQEPLFAEEVAGELSSQELTEKQQSVELAGDQPSVEQVEEQLSVEHVEEQLLQESVFLDEQPAESHPPVKEGQSLRDSVAVKEPSVKYSKLPAMTMLAGKELFVEPLGEQPLQEQQSVELLEQASVKQTEERPSVKLTEGQSLQDSVVIKEPSEPVEEQPLQEPVALEEPAEGQPSVELVEEQQSVELAEDQASVGVTAGEHLSVQSVGVQSLQEPAAEVQTQQEQAEVQPAIEKAEVELLQGLPEKQGPADEESSVRHLHVPNQEKAPSNARPSPESAKVQAQPLQQQIEIQAPFVEPAEVQFVQKVVDSEIQSVRRKTEEVANAQPVAEGQPVQKPKEVAQGPPPQLFLEPTNSEVQLVQDIAEVQPVPKPVQELSALEPSVAYAGKGSSRLPPSRESSWQEERWHESNRPSSRQLRCSGKKGRKGRQCRATAPRQNPEPHAQPRCPEPVPRYSRYPVPGLFLGGLPQPQPRRNPRSMYVARYRPPFLISEALTPLRPLTGSNGSGIEAIKYLAESRQAVAEQQGGKPRRKVPRCSLPEDYHIPNQELLKYYFFILFGCNNSIEMKDLCGPFYQRFLENKQVRGDIRSPLNSRFFTKLYREVFTIFSTSPNGSPWVSLAANAQEKCLNILHPKTSRETSAVECKDVNKPRIAHKQKATAEENVDEQARDKIAVDLVLDIEMARKETETKVQQSQSFFSERDCAVSLVRVVLEHAIALIHIECSRDHTRGMQDSDTYPLVSDSIQTPVDFAPASAAASTNVLVSTSSGVNGHEIADKDEKKHSEVASGMNTVLSSMNAVPDSAMAVVESFDNGGSACCQREEEAVPITVNFVNTTVTDTALALQDGTVSSFEEGEAVIGSIQDKAVSSEKDGLGSFEGRNLMLTEGEQEGVELAMMKGAAQISEGVSVKDRAAVLISQEDQDQDDTVMSTEEQTVSVPLDVSSLADNTLTLLGSQFQQEEGNVRLAPLDKDGTIPTLDECTTAMVSSLEEACVTTSVEHSDSTPVSVCEQGYVECKDILIPSDKAAEDVSPASGKETDATLTSVEQEEPTVSSAQREESEVMRADGDTTLTVVEQVNDPDVSLGIGVISVEQAVSIVEDRDVTLVEVVPATSCEEIVAHEDVEIVSVKGGEVYQQSSSDKPRYDDVTVFGSDSQSEKQSGTEEEAGLHTLGAFPDSSTKLATVVHTSTPSKDSTVAKMIAAKSLAAQVRIYQGAISVIGQQNPPTKSQSSTCPIQLSPKALSDTDDGKQNYGTIEALPMAELHSNAARAVSQSCSPDSSVLTTSTQLESPFDEDCWVENDIPDFSLSQTEHTSFASPTTSNPFEELKKSHRKKPKGKPKSVSSRESSRPPSRSKEYGYPSPYSAWERIDMKSPPNVVSALQDQGNKDTAGKNNSRASSVGKFSVENKRSQSSKKSPKCFEVGSIPHFIAYVEERVLAVAANTELSFNVLCGEYKQRHSLHGRNLFISAYDVIDQSTLFSIIMMTTRPMVVRKGYIRAQRTAVSEPQPSRPRPRERQLSSRGGCRGRGRGGRRKPPRRYSKQKEQCN